MGHVECAADSGHLVKALAEDPGAVVDVRFVGHERGHGEGGLIFAALLGVVMGVSVREEGGFARDAPASVPGGLGKVGAVAVDDSGCARVVDAVFVGAVADDWASTVSAEGLGVTGGFLLYLRWSLVLSRSK